MEIFANVKSVAYYHSTKELYLVATVIEKRLNSPKKQFAEVQRRDQLNFKTSDTSDIRKFIDIVLSQEHVIIKTSQFETGKDRNNNPATKFIIDNIERCVVFKVKKIICLEAKAILGEIVKSWKLHHPFSMCVSGSSGVGKTQFAFNLIKNKLSGNIRHVVYFGCLNSKKPLNWHTKLPNISITYKEGIPNRDFFERLKPKTLVVIDDMYDDAINSKDISHAFRVTRRHLKFSIILISHNLFEPGKYGKTIRQNCEQFCLFTVI